MIAIHHGDMLAILPTLAENSVDCVITDPPYHLTSHKEMTRHRQADGMHHRLQKGFMNTAWDGGDISFRSDTWREVLRVLKPGGHMLVFGGSRTFHRIAVACEDAGFELRDTIMYLYNTGFPKSHDLSKAIDKHFGREREIIGQKLTGTMGSQSAIQNALHGWASGQEYIEVTAAASPEAEQWAGFGTALKPSFEAVLLFRKPLSEKTIAQNVLKHGTGGLNIDACRVPTDDSWNRKAQVIKNSILTHASAENANSRADSMMRFKTDAENHPAGRWPSNLLHDGSDEVLEAFAAYGSSKSARTNGDRADFTNSIGATSGASVGGVQGGYNRKPKGIIQQYGDQGSAARFYKSCSYEIHDVLSSLLSRYDIDIIDACQNANNVTTPSLQRDRGDEHDNSVPSHAPGYSPLGHEDTNQVLPLCVPPAGNSSSLSSATNNNTAQQNVEPLHAQQYAQNVRDAENPSDSCVTSSVQNPAKVKVKIVQDFLAPITSATESDEKLICDMLTAMIQNIESAVSLALPQQKHSLTCNHVSIAGTSEQTGTMKIMISLSTSAGCVENVTYAITARPIPIGNASRFKMCAKASTKERAGSTHPTVKPLKLMEYLTKLICPPGGTVLDPFAGSGTTGEAAAHNGFNAILIEREAEYIEDIKRRLTMFL